MSIRKAGYNKAKKFAHRLYSKIGRVNCPALGALINFGIEGLHHLSYKRGRARSRTESKERFKLLCFAERIIENPSVLIRYKTRREKIKKKKQKISRLQTEQVHYWTFMQTFGKLLVKLVVRQEGAGDKHFYSIMSKKVNKTKKIAK